MLKVYICEDDAKQCMHVKSIIEKAILIEAYDMELVMFTSDPHKIIESIQNTNNTGIYFLDIDLKTDIDGFILAESIRKQDPRGFIIFITANADMLPLTFKYKCEAMDYIIKGPDTDYIKRINSCLQEANDRFSGQNSLNTKVFNFKFGDTISHERFDNIILFENNPDNPHKISMYSTNRVVDFRSALKEVEKNLDERFAKCSNRCIINLDMLDYVDKKGNIVTMKTGQTVLASTRYIRSLLKKIQ